MRAATQEEIQRYINYRANHVALVQRLGRLAFNADFSDHDHDKLECDERELNLQALRNAMHNEEYRPLLKDKRILQRLAGKHVKSQKHHPEYWDVKMSIDKYANDEETQVYATHMPKRYLQEMTCDWAALALKLNKPIFDWYNKTCTGADPKFVFTDNQKAYIQECLIQIEKTVQKYNISYPGIPYTVKQVEPLKEAVNNTVTNADYVSIIYSPEFKAWFGDWENDPEHASKVVDDYGKPMIMYHGSLNSRIKVFSLDKHENVNGGMPFLTFFTPDLKSAEEYARSDEGSSGKVYPVFLNIRKPVDSDNLKNIRDEFYSKYRYWLKDNQIQKYTKYDIPITNKELKKIDGHVEYRIQILLKKAQEESSILRYIEEGFLQNLDKYGYDGIIDRHVLGDSEYAVLSPNQVKSVANKGEFSVTSRNIYESIHLDSFEK